MSHLTTCPGGAQAISSRWIQTLIGIAAAMLWAVETMLLNSALSSGTLLNADFAEASLAAAALLDLCSAVYMALLYTARGEIGKLLPALRSPGERRIMVASLLGGPFGMTCYLLAIQTAGAGPAVSVSALYPAIGALLAAIFLREQLRSWQKAGLTVSVSGAVLLSALGGGAISRWSGLIPALVCALCWGSEAVISSSGMKLGDISSELGLLIRQITSATAYWLILLPMSGSLKTAVSAVKSDCLLWVLLAAVAGTASFLCYFRTIRNLGSSKAMALNITYTAWVVMMESALHRTSPGFLPILCAMLISSGSALTAYEQNKQELKV